MKGLSMGHTEDHEGRLTCSGIGCFIVLLNEGSVGRCAGVCAARPKKRTGALSLMLRGRQLPHSVMG